MANTAAGLLRGTIHVHEKGFGFVTADGTSAFVPPPLLNRFLHDDVVEASYEEQGTRRTVVEARLLHRPRTSLFGRILTRQGQRFLRVDRAVANTDWPLSAADDVNVADLREGLAVLADISGTTARFRCGIDERDVALFGLLARYRLEAEPPASVLAAATAAPSSDDVIARELPRRRDLRTLSLVTIDGPSTKDIDDAVYCFEADDDGALRILVAIADVGALVTEGSVLDDDARARATSVYLPDRVLPMLPRELSEDRLSLLPHVDRLCLCAELRIDVDGAVTAVDVCEGVMRSAARLTYDAVKQFLDDGDQGAVDDTIKPVLRRLRAAAARLAVQRAARGGVAVDRSEARLHFDDDGKPSGVSETVSTSAHTLIERLMVAANEGVARFLVDRGLPGLYRVHDAPDLEHTAALADAAAALGVEAAFSRRRPLTPLGLAAFDAQISNTVVESSARMLLRRLLGPARYSPDPSGHFGLAAPLYLHFTSPIRRYADLVVHRILKRFIAGERAFSGDGLHELAAAIDDASRRAARAEDERTRSLVASTLKQRIGHRFVGRVVGHKPFGTLVQLPGIVATLAEGRPALGTAVDVTIAAVDVELGRVEVVLA